MTKHSKRGQGEGSITPTKSGYRARVLIDGHRISRNFNDRKQASSWINDLIAQSEEGISYDAGNTPLSDFLSNWLKDKKSDLRLKTFYQYSTIVDNHISPILGKIKLRDLRANQVQDLYRIKKESGHIRTVRLIHSVLSSALSTAVKLGMIVRNVCDATTPPKLKPKEIKPPSDSESDRLLISLQKHPLKAAFYIAILTGIRKGELLGLKWSDLDWITGEIHIQRQIQQIPGHGTMETELKTDRSRRTIRIGEGMLKMLRDHNNIQQIARQFAGRKWKENDYIFPSSIGTSFEPRNFDRVWYAIREKAGVSCRFHDLRHRAASVMLVKLDMSPTEVAAALGHSRTSTTLDIYGHLITSMKPDRVKAMEDVTIPEGIDESGWPTVGPKIIQEKVEKQ